MTLFDFLNEFERLLNKTKKYGSSISSDISSYQLLKAANFSEYHEQLTRAVISNLNFDSPSSWISLENPSFA